MCGYAGWTGPSSDRSRDLSILRAMGGLLARRGPDDERVVQRDEFRLVFRRLAINDISRGAQPFLLDGGRLIVGVNGEIYNHRELARRELADETLATRSDCEIIGHLYRRLGARFLEVLNGIFAIADGSPLLFVGMPGYVAWLVWLLATGLRLVRAGT